MNVLMLSVLENVDFGSVLVTLLGAFLLGVILRSACRVSFVNRPDNEGISLSVTRISFWILTLPFLWSRDQELAHRYRGWLGAIYVALLIGVYFAGVMVSFACFYWAWGAVDTFGDALIASGSALNTLGFETPDNLVGKWLAIPEGAFGLGIVVFLLTFVPGYQAALNDREEHITWLYCRLGANLDGNKMLRWLLAHPSQMQSFWNDWEFWFRRNLKSHVQAPFLLLMPAFRYGQHWVEGFCAVMDAASFLVSIDQAIEEKKCEIEDGQPSRNGKKKILQNSNLSFEEDNRICLKEGILMMQFFCRLPRWESRLQAQVPDRDKFNEMWKTIESDISGAINEEDVWKYYVEWNRQYSSGVALFASELRLAKEVGLEELA